MSDLRSVIDCYLARFGQGMQGGTKGRQNKNITFTTKCFHELSARSKWGYSITFAVIMLVVPL